MNTAARALVTGASAGIGRAFGVTATQSQPATDVPAWLVQTPDQVVARALAAPAGREGPTILSSRRKALLANPMRLLPKKAAVSPPRTG